MELFGEYRLPGEREAIWQALQDPEVLKATIPGCTELEKLSESEFTAEVTTGLAADGER
jgi:carbon monoxide dehydrogenase subunit G